MNAGEIPLRVSGNYVVNDDARAEDSGYGVGIKVGKARNPGDVEVGYLYREVEANTVIGAFSDSDFGGGGTDNEGHRLKGKVALKDSWTAGATLYPNTIGPNGADIDYTRLQLDLVANF